MVSLTKVRTAATALALAAALAACSGSGGPAPTATDDTGSETVGTRTVEHALGTTEVPTDPQRIVVLDSAYLLDNIVALGLGEQIVGRVDLNGVGDVEPAWLTDDVDFSQITYLGSLYPDGIDLEALAALEPDLVIGVGSAFGDQYEQISTFTAAVAPVMAEGYVVGSWNELTIATGELMGMQEQAQVLVAEVEQHLADRIAQAPADLTDRTLTTIGGWTGDPALYYSASEDVTWMLEAAGFDLNPGFPDSDYELLTPELYPQLESDVLAVADFAYGALDYDALLTGDAVLSSLTAVQEDQYVVVDGLLLASSGPLGLPDAIDVVFDELTARWHQ